MKPPILVHESAASCPDDARDPPLPCAPSTPIALLHGGIGHERLRPANNAFRYPAFFLRLPLSKLADLEAGGIAYNRWGLVSFHDRDHGARDGTPLKAWIAGILAAHGVRAGGEVVLHAFPRMLGYVFNPVSFWVCHDPAGAAVAVVCEVCNTFGERHNYLLAHPDGRPLASGETLHANKAFHVSPYCAVRGRYAFRFHFAPDRWLARIDYFDGDNALPLLRTSVHGEAETLSVGGARALLRRYPLFTSSVILRIHWQAVKLWLARVPFHRKPAPPLEETTR